MSSNVTKSGSKRGMPSSARYTLSSSSRERHTSITDISGSFVREPKDGRPFRIGGKGGGASGGTLSVVWEWEERDGGGDLKVPPVIAM